MNVCIFLFSQVYVELFKGHVHSYATKGRISTNPTTKAFFRTLGLADVYE
jgi:hypothetical protein